LEARAAVLDGLHRRWEALSQAAGHDEAPGRQAARARAGRRRWQRSRLADGGRPEEVVRRDRGVPRAEANALFAAHDRAGAGAPQPGDETLWRRAADRNHSDVNRRVPARASRRGYREQDHQHGRRRPVARAQVLRSLAGAGRPRAQPAGTSASSRPRVGGGGAAATIRHGCVESGMGARVLRPRSSPRTHRCDL
jgi:hypothetical protein